MRALRWILVGAGGATALYGAWLLVSRQSGDQLSSAGLWLLGGVVVHDLVLAPLAVLVVAIAGRWLPRWAHAPAALFLVVVGSVTIAAIPVLAALGRRADNPTLLDRDYWAGWLVLVGCAGALGLVAALGSRSQRWRRSDGSDLGR